MTQWVDRRTGLEVLDREESLRRLGEQRVGRLATVGGGGVEIFPVNYALDGDVVVFRSAGGTKVRLAQRAEVAFEIDEIDPDSRTGWSVVVHGHVDEVPDHLAEGYARTIGVDPWADGEKPHVLRIRPTAITGRRIA